MEIPRYFEENLRGSCVVNNQSSLCCKLLNSENGCIPEISYQGILVLRASDGTVWWSCEYLLFKESGYALLWHRELLLFFLRKAVQFSSVTQSWPTLCDPMDCSMPGLPLHHQLLEFTQIHVHWVGDAHPLLLNESARLIRWPKVFEVSAWTSVLPVNTQDWSPLGWTGWISKAIRKELKQIKQKSCSVLLVNKSRVIYLSLNSRCHGSKSVFIPSVSLSKL